MLGKPGFSYEMYSLPQEIEVWYIIPAIRKEIATCLIREHKITYARVGEILGLTKAAVSQYLNNRRAGKITLPEQARKQVAKSCVKIVKGKSNAVKEILDILKFIREKDLPCRVCEKHDNGALVGCKEIRIKRDYIDKWGLKT